jgi:hypothetical protein
MQFNWSDITLSAFTQPNELFQSRPSFVWELKPLYMVFLAILLLAGIVTPFLKKWLRDEVRKPIVQTAWTHFFIGIVLFYLRDSRVPVLGMDIWRVIQYIALIVWFVLYVTHLRTTVKTISLKEEVALRREKYLPKPKK